MTDEKKPEMKIEVWPIDQLIPYARNPRHNEESVDAVAASIKAFGWKQPIVVDKENVIVIGHTRMKAARRLGMTHVPVHVSDLSDEENKALRIADNSTASKSGFDLDLLKLELPELPSFKMEEFNLDLGFLNEPANPRDEQEHKTLADRFMVPPFSVLNAREGWWQDRKRAWIALGIKSELGRGGGGATPPHPPGITRNADGTLNYTGSKGQAERFDRQRQQPRQRESSQLQKSRQAQRISPGGSPRPACDYSKRQRGDGRGRAINE